MRHICEVTEDLVPCEEPAVDFIEITVKGEDGGVLQIWMCSKHYDHWMNHAPREIET
jgi:hypothetical protein